MKYPACLVLLLICLASCLPEGSTSSSPAPVDNNTPHVTSDATFTVLNDLDITFADGLAHSDTSVSPFSIPLKLDVYYPDNSSTNRPVFMWIHGGGFTGGKKDKPEIVEMARFYASRGWVFVSIDYRTTEELCDSKTLKACNDKLIEIGQSGPNGLLDFYRGVVPAEWLQFTIDAEPGTIKRLQQSLAQYTAQRDAKAALRWIVANAETYAVNTDYITVGGNSAGAVTTIALGISHPADFRDEISVDDDPTLSTTHLSETFEVRSMIHFWGSNAKLDLYEAVYDLEKYARYDNNDPELFMGHGEAEDLQTPYEEALELQGIYADLGIYSELKTLLTPVEDDPWCQTPSACPPAGHGAWDGVADGKGLFDLTFDFLVARQGLIID